MPRVRRTKLEQYPCGFAQDELMGDPVPCGGDCPAVEFNRPCPFLLIYRQAIADARCARLLGIFERHMLYYHSYQREFSLRWQRFLRYFRDALRMAGLEE